MTDDLKRRDSELKKENEQLKSGVFGLNAMVKDFQEREEKLIELCKNAAKVFRHYEALHAAKPDMVKAKSNGDLAASIEDALKILGLC